MKKTEKIVCITVLVLLLVMLGYSYWKGKEIDKNPVYVKAKVYATQDTENGPICDFKYSYESVEYKSYAKTSSVYWKDSIIILKISKSNPKLWEVVDEMP